MERQLVKSGFPVPKLPKQLNECGSVQNKFLKWLLCHVVCVLSVRPPTAQTSFGLLNVIPETLAKNKTKVLKNHSIQVL